MHMEKATGTLSLSEHMFFLPSAEGLLQRDLTILTLNAYSRIHRVPPRSLVAREYTLDILQKKLKKHHLNRG
jgi:hypothetical protein